MRSSETRSEHQLHAHPVAPADVIVQRLEAVLAHKLVEPLPAEVVEVLQLAPMTVAFCKEKGAADEVAPQITGCMSGR